MTTLTSQEFGKTWAGVVLLERLGYQQPFLDPCAMLVPPAPAEADSAGFFYAIEKSMEKGQPLTLEELLEALGRVGLTLSETGLEVARRRTPGR